MRDVVPYGRPLAGRLDQHVFASELLRDNPLGDPSERPLWVYVPPGYDESAARHPAIYLLAGWTGVVPMSANRNGYEASHVEELDSVFAAGDVPGAVLVFVDGWTRFGGSQYLDSPATGRYHSYLCDEIVPWVDEHYRTLTSREHRGVAGHSTGGFGAVVTAMLRPDLFSAFADHAGDGLYEYLFLPLFAKVVKMLRERHSSSWDVFFEHIDERSFFLDGELDALMVYGAGACYSAQADGSVRLPVDAATGRLDDEVWSQWLAYDPVRMVARYADAMRSMKAVWVDGGTSDEYNLDLAATALAAALREVGVSDDVLHFELHEGGHGGTFWRQSLSMRWLAERLSP